VTVKKEEQRQTLQIKPGTSPEGGTALFRVGSEFALDLVKRVESQINGRGEKKGY